MSFPIVQFKSAFFFCYNVAAEQTTEQISEEIERAHVICIVFAVDRQETLNKIASYWLPFVRDSTSDDCRKPIILVGNKIDLIDYSIIDVSFTCILFQLYFISRTNMTNTSYLVSDITNTMIMFSIALGCLSSKNILNTILLTELIFLLL